MAGHICCAPFFFDWRCCFNFIIEAKFLTLLNLSDEVSIGLGANTKFIRFIATMVVLIFSAIAVIVIYPVGYVGLIYLHIVRRFVNPTIDMSFRLPWSWAVFLWQS